MPALESPALFQFSEIPSPSHMFHMKQRTMNKPFNWKIFWILVAAAAFGLIAILPYVLALQANQLATAKLPMPLPLIIAIQLAPQVVAFAIAIALGLFFANRIGLGLPILEAKLRGEPVGELLRAIVPISVVLGLLGGLLIGGLA